MTADEMFNQAIETARKRDEERERLDREGRLDELPALHGIPMSVKDQIRYTGTVSSLGTFSRCGQKSDTTAEAV